ncbi:MAG: RNA-binding protein, partial [Verrucomicrobiota bacterium]
MDSKSSGNNNKNRSGNRSPKGKQSSNRSSGNQGPRKQPKRKISRKPKPTLWQRVMRFFGLGPEKAVAASRAKDVKGPRLFVGNLDYSVKDSDLKDFFGRFGPVKSAEIATDVDVHC